MVIEISMDRETIEPRILIADDQQDVLDALRLLLKGHGYSIETVNSPADLLAAVARQEFDTATIFAAIILIIAFVHGMDQHVLGPLQASVSRHYAG